MIVTECPGCDNLQVLLAEADNGTAELLAALKRSHVHGFSSSEGCETCALIARIEGGK